VTIRCPDCGEDNKLSSLAWRVPHWARGRGLCWNCGSEVTRPEEREEVPCEEE
jgi:hypothetical protein